MAGCVWGMWVAMSSNWELITKFGCFYHFALLRTARECTKFLNACAEPLFCQLHLLFCHILFAIDVFGLHKLSHTTIFLNLFMSTMCKEESTILIESKKPLSILQLTWNSIHGEQNKQIHTTLHVNKNWQIKRNRDSKISFSSNLFSIFSFTYLFFEIKI